MADDTAPGAGKSSGFSRYQRVKAILNDAAGDSAARYQGYDRFWELPVAQFLEVEIYGVRMIAPPDAQPVTGAAASTQPETSCCHAVTAVPVPQADDRRGARSGLIQGLNGEFPFDGSQFPPLPWGGRRVSAPDSRFIEQWIDAGCPEDDASVTAVQVSESHRAALAMGDAEHPPLAFPVNQYHEQAGSLKIRKNVACLTDDELKRFRAALAHMKSLDGFYQDERSFAFWARIHGNLCQHGWEEFLTWHRAYLYFFELQLQDVDPTVTLPYWNWPQYRDDVAKSIEDMGADVPTDNGIIPEAYRCWLDRGAYQRLEAGGQVPAEVLVQLSKILDRKFDSGARLFKATGIDYSANPASNRAIMAELGRINPLWHKQRWPGGDKSIIFEAYPTPDDVQRILQTDNFFRFGSGPSDNHFFGALENIHNLLHNFSGGSNPNYVKGTPPANRDEPQYGDMVNAGVTAFDPIFWGHHGNVDRMWAQWQTLHPGGGPNDPTSVLPPWNLTVQDTYSTHALGYEYMMESHVFPTDNGTPIQRFRSAAAPVATHVLSAHGRAEVRLHAVQMAPVGGFHVRVFLNTPGATINTPTRGNDHYVGQVNVFTGFCIGGPGHCDVPPKTRRKFDKRKRHHKTPGNFHIDATETVRQLIAKGASDFQVNLIAVNTDGSPAIDALLMDAVSLNFTD